VVCKGKMQQEDLWGWNRSFLATHRRSHAPSTLWHLQVVQMSMLTLCSLLLAYGDRPRLVPC